MSSPRAGGHTTRIWWGVRSAVGSRFRLLPGWFVLLAALVVAARLWTDRLESNPRPGLAVSGWYLIGLLLLLVFAVPLLSGPSAASVTGLVAAWVTSLVFLATALPLALVTMTMGGVPGRRVAAAWLALAALLGVFTVLWHAAVLAAPDQAAALARYLGAALGLVVGTFVACTLVLLRDPYDGRAWWLLAPNPYAVLVDAVADPVPGPGGKAYRESGDNWFAPWDPLESARLALNDVRDPLWEDTTDDCEVDPAGGCVDNSRRPGPVWPYGLAAEAGIATGALALAARRRPVAA
jgi:ABC-2 type transport system permease protein